MKKLSLILPIILFMSVKVSAQLHDYSFNNTFSSNNAAAPTLVENLTCGATNGAL